MNLAAMVDEVGRAVSASVSRSLAPITRQVEELLAWRKSVGELRNGVDGPNIDEVVAKVLPLIPPAKNGKDGDKGEKGQDAAPVDIDAIVAKAVARIPVPKNGEKGEDGRHAPPVDLDSVVVKVLPLIRVPADGKNGENAPPVDVDAIVAKVQSQIRVPKDGKDGEDGKSPPPVDVDAVVAKVLALVPKPENGRDAPPVDTDAIVLKVLSQIVVPVPKDGINGKDGVDAKPVDVDAIIAKVMSQVRHGTDGKNGDGIQRLDYDEKANSLDIVLTNGEICTVPLPTPKQGDKGDKGLDGTNGIDAPAVDLDAIVSKVLPLVPVPNNGVDGDKGDKGDPPSTEEVAAAITKACDALLPAMVSKHMESLMPEIITRASLLVPPGRDGLPGRPGTPGEDGKPGVGIESVELDFAGKRTGTLILRMSDGGRQEMPMNIGPVLRDAGVHRPGADYEEGDCVTHGGSYWVAKADTNATPGKSDDWRMVVKRGRDGRDAPGAEE